jgi:hypothetical protein
MTALRAAGLAFGLLALTAGGLQIWAFTSSGFSRHLVLGVFASAVGLCVLVAACAPGGPRWPR